MDNQVASEWYFSPKYEFEEKFYQRGGEFFQYYMFGRRYQLNIIVNISSNCEEIYIKLGVIIYL